MTSKKAEPDFSARAQAALAEIEREAAARRGAIEGLFGNAAEDAASTGKAPASRTRKAGSDEQS